MSFQTYWLVVPVVGSVACAGLIVWLLITRPKRDPNMY